MSPPRHAGSLRLEDQPDHVLVERAQGGSEPAFEAIVIRHGAYLLGVARSVGPADRAEDVLQQALLQALVALRRRRPILELRPWLRRIVVNASVDLSRRDGPPPLPVREEELAGEGVDSILERRQQLRRLVRDLRDLPDRQREAILMRELEGRPFDEIASELGTSRVAARQLVSRARARLRTGVAALAPAELLARLLGAGAKLGAAVAVGGSAVSVGALAPPVDLPVSRPPAPRVAAGPVAPPGPAGPARPIPAPAGAAAGRSDPGGATGTAGPRAGAQQGGDQQGGDAQAVAAGAATDGQSQSGEGTGQDAAGGGQAQQSG